MITNKTGQLQPKILHLANVDCSLQIKSRMCSNKSCHNGLPIRLDHWFVSSPNNWSYFGIHKKVRLQLALVVIIGVLQQDLFVMIEQLDWGKGCLQ